MSRLEELRDSIHAIAKQYDADFNQIDRRDVYEVLDHERRYSIKVGWCLCKLIEELCRREQTDGEGGR